MNWPARYLDLISLDFLLLGFVKDVVSKTSFFELTRLKR